jgi:hypothetical protein
VSTCLQATEVFISIHDLISSHDDGLRWSREVYDHVRTCFDVLYEYIGDGEKTETSYHGEVGVEKWRLCGGVMEQYGSILQKVKEELRLDTPPGLWDILRFHGNVQDVHG